LTSVLARERVARLQGGRNFRDLGGYETRDGRRLKWGRLFRSGSLSNLTPADWDTLVAHGIRVVCDLRTTQEREREPFMWADAPGLTYFTRDYATSFGELRKAMTAQLPTGEAARAAMCAAFRNLPYEQAPAYRRLFAHLAANDLPMIFNCSAGKDRAGTAAALVLCALGVPRETIIEDFVLTDVVGGLRQSMLRRADEASLLSRQPPEIADAILGAHPEYIAAALAAVESRHGSIEGYMREVLELDDSAVMHMRENLLD
jgi:protein-tyrosine phosphatase